MGWPQFGMDAHKIIILFQIITAHPFLVPHPLYISELHATELYSPL